MTQTRFRLTIAIALLSSCVAAGAVADPGGEGLGTVASVMAPRALVSAAAVAVTLDA